MTLLTLSHPLLPGLSLPGLRLLVTRLAGHAAGLPARLEDWQLRDLDLTRPQRSSVWPGPNPLSHYDLP